MKYSILRDKTFLIGSVLGLVNISIHLAVYHKLEYHRDELLYFSLGMHPALGYNTVPPMIGWLASVMQLFFGYSLFAVKLFPALFSGVFLYLCVVMTKELGGKLYAQFLTGFIILLMPFTLRTSHLFMPVFLDLFFWTFILYLCLKYLNTNQDRYLLVIGAMAGLAMLNKYLIAILICCLLLATLVTSLRFVWKKKPLYYGMVAGFLLFLPNIIWQVMHHFPVVQHMKELHDTQLVYVKPAEFLTDQLLMPFAGSLLMVPGLVYLVVKKQYRFLGITALLVTIAILLLRGKAYYTIGVMPLMIAAGAVVYERFLAHKAVRIAFMLLLLLISLPALPVGVPVWGKKGLVEFFRYPEQHYGITAGRRWEDGKIHTLPQDYADQLGWEEMTKLAFEAWQQIPDKKAAFIYGENYGEAGAISVIGKKYGLPEAISFNESFHYWIPKQFDPDIQSLVYINSGDMGDDVKELFADIRLIGRVSDPYAREYGTYVYLCTQPRVSFNQFWKERIVRN